MGPLPIYHNDLNKTVPYTYIRRTIVRRKIHYKTIFQRKRTNRGKKSVCEREIDLGLNTWIEKKCKKEREIRRGREGRQMGREK